MDRDKLEEVVKSKLVTVRVRTWTEKVLCITASNCAAACLFGLTTDRLTFLMAYCIMNYVVFSTLRVYIHLICIMHTAYCIPHEELPNEGRILVWSWRLYVSWFAEDVLTAYRSLNITYKTTYLMLCIVRNFWRWFLSSWGFIDRIAFNYFIVGKIKLH